ncbi:MAG: deoxyguanosinetriphosphate triphosphohydrolase [Zavarzinella sp.]
MAAVRYSGHMDSLEYESSFLASYAMRSHDSRGRQYVEPAHPYRAIYQRDRERIVHCSAFRRMVGKTQVLVGRINDHHRTRLTHTLEVAQISRTIARKLGINEDLTEAIALSHDIGHPPFGHAGERALHECLRHHAGFDHNLYGLRRVDWLEDRYPDHPGLNLSWEVREAFVQHSKRKDVAEVQEFFAHGGPLLEAQLVDAADSLAYDTHDADDALGTGILQLGDLEEIPFWAESAAIVRQRFTNMTPDQQRVAIVRELIAKQVNDLVRETEQQLQVRQIRTLADVRQCTEPLVRFSSELVPKKKEFQRFLLQHVYQDYRVLRQANKGREMLVAMYDKLVQKPELLPPKHFSRWEKAPAHIQRNRTSPSWGMEPSLERVVVDYLAGMTDQFARTEYTRLFETNEDW